MSRMYVKPVTPFPRTLVMTCPVARIYLLTYPCSTLVSPNQVFFYYTYKR